MVEQVISHNNGSIFYNDSGSGPCVTLLHGFPESKAIWKNYINNLSQHYRVIAIDLPGMGNTSIFAEVHTMNFMAKSVMVVWDHLGIKATSIIGHSMGGYVGLELLKMDTARVGQLCLFQSSASADTPAKKAARLKAVEVAKNDSIAFAQSNIEMLFAPGNKAKFPVRAKELAELASKTKTEGITAALLGMRKRQDHVATVQSSGKPIFYILGADDPILDAKQVSKQQGNADHIKISIVKGMGHLGFIEKEHECLDLLHEWLP